MLRLTELRRSDINYLIMSQLNALPEAEYRDHADLIIQRLEATRIVPPASFCQAQVQHLEQLYRRVLYAAILDPIHGW